MQHKIPFAYTHEDAHTHTHTLIYLNCLQTNHFSPIFGMVFFLFLSTSTFGSVYRLLSLAFREWMNIMNEPKSIERYMIAAAFFPPWSIQVIKCVFYATHMWYLSLLVCWSWRDEMEPFCNRNESSIWLDQWKYTWKLFTLDGVMPYCRFATALEKKNSILARSTHRLLCSDEWM